MSAEIFTALLERMLSRSPFQVLTIELNSGKRFEIDHPRAVVYRDGFAIFLAPGRIPIYFDNNSVENIVDAPANTEAEP